MYYFREQVKLKNYFKSLKFIFLFKVIEKIEGLISGDIIVSINKLTYSIYNTAFRKHFPQ